MSIGLLCYFSQGQMARSCLKVFPLVKESASSVEIASDGLWSGPMWTKDRLGMSTPAFSNSCPVNKSPCRGERSPSVRSPQLAEAATTQPTSLDHGVWRQPMRRLNGLPFVFCPNQLLPGVRIGHGQTLAPLANEQSDQSSISSSQSHFRATCSLASVVARTFSFPASIFWIVRGLTPTSSASRSWVSFRATRSLRTLSPTPARKVDCSSVSGTPYQAVPLRLTNTAQWGVFISHEGSPQRPRVVAFSSRFPFPIFRLRSSRQRMHGMSHKESS